MQIAKPAPTRTAPCRPCRARDHSPARATTSDGLQVDATRLRSSSSGGLLPLSAAAAPGGRWPPAISTFENLPAALRVYMSRSLRQRDVAALAATSRSNHALLQSELTMPRIYQLWASKLQVNSRLSGDWDRVNVYDAKCLYVLGDSAGALAMLDDHIRRRHKAPYDLEQAYAFRAQLRLNHANYDGALRDAGHALKYLYDPWSESTIPREMYRIEAQACYLLDDAAQLVGPSPNMLAQALAAHRRHDHAEVADILGWLVARPEPTANELAAMALLHALTGKSADAAQALERALNEPDGDMAIAHILASEHLNLSGFSVPWLEKFGELQLAARSTPCTYPWAPRCFPEWEPPF